MSSIQNLKYSYKTNYSSGESEQEFVEPPKKVVFSSQGSSKGAAKVSKDEVIEVNVKWGDMEESFKLQNKSE